MIDTDLKYQAVQIAHERVAANREFYHDTFRQRGDAFKTEFKGILAEMLAQAALEEKGLEYQAAEFIQEQVTNKPDLIVGGLRIDVKGCIGSPKVNKQTADKTDIDVYLFYMFDEDFTTYYTIKATPEEIKNWELITVNQNNQFYIMQEKIYLGNAWEDEYGLNVSVNLEKFLQAVKDGKMTQNKYGDVRIRVGKLRTPNEKSKATHYVAVATPPPPKDNPF